MRPSPNARSFSKEVMASPSLQPTIRSCELQSDKPSLEQSMIPEQFDDFCVATRTVSNANRRNRESASFSFLASLAPRRDSCGVHGLSGVGRRNKVSGAARHSHPDVRNLERDPVGLGASPPWVRGYSIRGDARFCVPTDGRFGGVGLPCQASAAPGSWPCRAAPVLSVVEGSLARLSARNQSPLCRDARFCAPT